MKMVWLRLSSNMVGNSDGETNWLANRQVENLRKAFANYTAVNIKLSKTQLCKNITIRRLYW